MVRAPEETPAEAWARRRPSPRHGAIAAAAPDVFRAIPEALEGGIRSPCWKDASGAEMGPRPAAASPPEKEAERGLTPGGLGPLSPALPAPAPRQAHVPPRGPHPRGAPPDFLGSI